MRRSIIAALLMLALAGCGTLQEGNPTVTTGSGAPITRPSATVAPEPATEPTESNPAGETMPEGTGGKQWDTPPAMTIDPSKKYTAQLETSKGPMTIELFAGEAPMTVNNFVFLSREGFYDNVKFHRVISGFMVQTGDPLGNGTGSPGYRFDDEPVKREYKRGIVAMANSGPNTNGSQFFIMHADYGLPPSYTIFGQVVEGLDTLDAIASVPVSMSEMGEQSVPNEDIRILKVTIAEE